ncbi:MAG: hypothetical protein KDK99_03940 [Verrucomicrobiales bacterium]|nr:hypothetical protein [Verrucomicrobiales bacterium]
MKHDEQFMETIENVFKQFNIKERKIIFSRFFMFPNQWLPRSKFPDLPSENRRRDASGAARLMRRIRKKSGIEQVALEFSMKALLLLIEPRTLAAWLSPEESPADRLLGVR